MSKGLRYISLFSGGMGLDLGLEQAGLKPAVSVEIDKHCCTTIKQNRPGLSVVECDISSLSTADILDAAKLKVGQAFAVVGGPPCQSFSTGGLRQSLHDRRGSLIGDFLRVIDEAKPRHFVFENVAQIVTAAVKHRPIALRPGKRWHLGSYKTATRNKVLFDDDPLTDDEQSGSAIRVILDSFAQLGYTIRFGIVNAADYGVPQKRLRFVAIGTREKSAIDLPKPTHSEAGADGLPEWRTLRDAIGELRENEPLHANYTEAFQRYFALVPPGSNWRALPPELQREALGEKAYAAGGGKTGFFRRLAWDEPAPTIVGKPNRKSGAICHPEHVRPLTVREVARVQTFPDDWHFAGSMHPQYLQVGNAVPVGLGYAIGKALQEKRSAKSLDSWDDMLTAAQLRLRAAARNKLARRVARNTFQAELGF